MKIGLVRTKSVGFDVACICMLAFAYIMQFMCCFLQGSKQGVLSLAHLLP